MELVLTMGLPGSKCLAYFYLWSHLEAQSTWRALLGHTVYSILEVLYQEIF